MRKCYRQEPGLPGSKVPDGLRRGRPGEMTCDGPRETALVLRCPPGSPYHGIGACPAVLLLRLSASRRVPHEEMVIGKSTGFWNIIPVSSLGSVTGTPSTNICPSVGG